MSNKPYDVAGINRETIRKLHIKCDNLQESNSKLKKEVQRLTKYNKELVRENLKLQPPLPPDEPSIPYEPSEETRAAFLERERQRDAERFIVGYCDECGKSIVKEQSYKRTPFSDDDLGLNHCGLFCDATCKQYHMFGKDLRYGKIQSKSPYWGSWRK